MTFPISNFLDFYLLETIQHFVSSDPDAEFRHSKHRLLRDVELELALLSRDFACALHDYIFLACIGEARHAFEDVSVILNALRHDVTRGQAYDIALEYSPESYPVLVELFKSKDWHGSFGGKFWANVAKALDMVYVYHVPDKAFVDYCADLKHNNGLIFDKPVVIENDLSTGALASLLDDKRDAKDFCVTACERQYYGNVNYECQYVHLKTSQLVNRYMNLYHHNTTDFYGCKPNNGYEPLTFGNNILELVANEHIHYCSTCGDQLPSDDTYTYESNYYCYSCYEGIDKPEEEDKYCDACGKKRTSTNQYWLDGMSLCHACYNDKLAEQGAEKLFNVITSSVLHK